MKALIQSDLCSVGKPPCSLTFSKLFELPTSPYSECYNSRFYVDMILQHCLLLGFGVTQMQLHNQSHVTCMSEGGYPGLVHNGFHADLLCSLLEAADPDCM